jgi:hypothetical protein
VNGRSLEFMTIDTCFPGSEINAHPVLNGGTFGALTLNGSREPIQTNGFGFPYIGIMPIFQI